MLIRPHGGKLVNRMVTAREKEELMNQCSDLVQISLSDDKLKEVRNIAHGVFSPLEGFMTRLDLDPVVTDSRLSDNNYWTVPILLAVDRNLVEKLEMNSKAALTDSEGKIYGALTIEDIFEYDKKKMAKSVFGTEDAEHPGVAKIYGEGDYYIGGPIDLFEAPPTPYDDNYLSPRETRYLFNRLGFRTVAAFQTRNPPHRAHEYLQKCALEVCDGLFINPVIGKKKVGDFTDHLILKTYRKLIEAFYPKDRAVLSILPWEMRYAGPKEAIFHGIVRKNFGCSHHIIGRDHAGVGDYYGTFDAQEIFSEFPGLEIEPLKFEHSFYCVKCGNMGTCKTCPHPNEDHVNPSGTKIRGVVTEGAEVSPKIMRPEIAGIIASDDDPFVK